MALKIRAARTDSAANVAGAARAAGSANAAARTARAPRTARALRTGVALLAVLGLAGVSACEVSLSASDSATTAPAGGSRIATAEATGDVSIRVEATGTGAPSGAPQSEAPTAGASGPGSAPGAGIMPTAGSRDSATAGSGASSGRAGAGSGGGAGSGAAASDCSWLDEMASSATLVSADSDTYRIDQVNKAIRIQDDLTTLTVSGSNATVYVNRVDNLVIDGANAKVYVCSVNTVTVDSEAGNATVEWGGDVAPVVRDSGANTDVVPHRG